MYMISKVADPSHFPCSAERLPETDMSKFLEGRIKQRARALDASNAKQADRNAGEKESPPGQVREVLLKESFPAHAHPRATQASAPPSNCSRASCRPDALESTITVRVVYQKPTKLEVKGAMANW